MAAPNSAAAKISMAILSPFEKEVLLKKEGNAAPIIITPPISSIVSNM